MMIFAASCAHSYSGGNGTEADPYTIAAPDDLAQIDGEAYYAIMDNITLPEDWETIPAFSGHLDGNDHTITVKDSVLFGTVRGSIEALRIDGSISRAGGVGGIALELCGGTIDGCTVSADIEGTKSGEDTHADSGGIVSVMRSGAITNCNVQGKIRVEGVTFPRTGGITALMYGGKIISCSVTGEIESNGDSAIAGGIAGQANISPDMGISECTFSGKVISTRYAGGITGHLRGGKITNNNIIAGSEVSGAYLSGGIVGKIAETASLSGNTYTGASYGIGENEDGIPSDEGCTRITEEDTQGESSNDGEQPKGTQESPVEDNEQPKETQKDNETANDDTQGQPVTEEQEDSTDTTAGNSNASGSGGGGCNTGIGFMIAYVLSARRFFARK